MREGHESNIVTKVRSGEGKKARMGPCASEQTHVHMHLVAKRSTKKKIDLLAHDSPPPLLSPVTQ